jgi:hypothetical protein
MSEMMMIDLKTQQNYGALPYEKNTLLMSYFLTKNKP